MDSARLISRRSCGAGSFPPRCGKATVAGRSAPHRRRPGLSDMLTSGASRDRSPFHKGICEMLASPPRTNSPASAPTRARPSAPAATAANPADPGPAPARSPAACRAGPGFRTQQSSEGPASASIPASRPASSLPDDRATPLASSSRSAIAKMKCRHQLFERRHLQAIAGLPAADAATPRRSDGPADAPAWSGKYLTSCRHDSTPSAGRTVRALMPGPIPPMTSSPRASSSIPPLPIGQPPSWRVPSASPRRPVP